MNDSKEALATGAPASVLQGPTWLGPGGIEDGAVNIQEIFPCGAGQPLGSVDGEVEISLENDLSELGHMTSPA